MVELMIRLFAYSSLSTRLLKVKYNKSNSEHSFILPCSCVVRVREVEWIVVDVTVDRTLSVDLPTKKNHASLVNEMKMLMKIT